jgi:hypothetical protein
MSKEKYFQEYIDNKLEDSVYYVKVKEAEVMDTLFFTLNFKLQKNIGITNNSLRSGISPLELIDAHIARGIAEMENKMRDMLFRKVEK